MYLDFDTPLHPGEDRFPSYDGYTSSIGAVTERVFAIPTQDSITRVDVWADGSVVNAIQLHLSSGMVSELYGVPRHGCEHHAFQGKYPDSRLVGIHGTCGEGLYKLGFTFAIHLSSDDDSLITTEQPKDTNNNPSIGTKTKEATSEGDGIMYTALKLMLVDVPKSMLAETTECLWKLWKD